MWTLKIKQTVPREGYTVDEEVIFKSDNFNKLAMVIQHLESNIETEFIIKKEEDNDAQ